MKPARQTAPGVAPPKAGSAPGPTRKLTPTGRYRLKRNDPVDRFCEELIAANGKKSISFVHRGVAVDDVALELARRGYVLVHEAAGRWFAEKGSNR